MVYNIQDTVQYYIPSNTSLAIGVIVGYSINYEEENQETRNGERG